MMFILTLVWEVTWILNKMMHAKVHKIPTDPPCMDTGAQVAQWVRSLDLTTHTSLSPIQRGFVPGFVNYKKKSALDSQPQVIKFTSCLPMVGGSLRLPPPLKLVAMIHVYSWNIVESGIKTPKIKTHLWTSYIATFQTLQSSIIFVDCFKHRFPTKWPSSTVYIQN